MDESRIRPFVLYQSVSETKDILLNRIARGIRDTMMLQNQFEDSSLQTDNLMSESLSLLEGVAPKEIVIVSY